MKELLLSNKQKVMIEDESYPLLVVIYEESYAKVDQWKNIITEENMNGAIMDGMTISNIIFFTMHTSSEGNRIRMEFLFREQTEQELLLSRISELEDAVNFLLMGGDE